MGEPVVQVPVPLDALQQVPKGRRKTVPLADFRPLKRGPADDTDGDRPLRASAPLDAQFVNARIERVKKFCSPEEIRIRDIRHPVREHGGVVVVEHITTYCNESPALRWAPQLQHLCRYCSAEFPGRIPPYAGQSSIFPS